MENSINMELLKKENVEHEKIFKQFHKYIFWQMSKEAIKMAVTILLDHGWYPTDLDFEDQKKFNVKVFVFFLVEVILRGNKDKKISNTFFFSI